MNIPLLAALRDLRRERTPGTIALYAVIGAVMLLLATVPVCGPMQDELARAHHARAGVTWPLVQVIPKMYSFAHRVAFGEQPAAPTLWINHSPARVIRLERSRQSFLERGVDQHLLVRSAYRGRRWVTRFVVHPHSDGIWVETLGSEP